MTIRLISLLSILIISGLAHAGETRYISIGTGGITGVYYPSGGAICRLVNKDRKTHKIRCSVESTGGSIFNINTMRSGELDFGVAQSDWQYHAYKGTSKFSDAGAYEQLRSVFSLHGEPFTVVARQDANIKNFEDLKGKRFNIGNPGSGQRATIAILMQALGWDMSVFKFTSELKASEQSRALCDNKIDAFVYVVGHPNASIKEASTACDTNLVNVSGEAIDKLIADTPYYAKAVIPGGMYKGTGDNVTTFGVKATLVSNSDVPEDVVYILTKAVFDNFDAFKSLHPAFNNLTPQQMMQGNSAPLHEGAVKYYKEQGWK